MGKYKYLKDEYFAEMHDVEKQSEYRDKFYKCPNQPIIERIPFHLKRKLTGEDIKDILNWYDNESLDYIKWVEETSIKNDGSHSDECLKEHKFMVKIAEKYYDKRQQDYLDKR